MNFGLLCTVQCTVVEVNVKVALLYSTKCNQTQRGGGGVVVVWWWCGGVVFSDYNTHPVYTALN